MKNYIIIGIIGLMLHSCASRKHAAPCKQCPHYTWSEAQMIEYRTMNPEVHIVNNITKIKLNGYKKFNKSDSTSRGIIF